jgi:hypothetical protein
MAVWKSETFGFETVIKGTPQYLRFLLSSLLMKGGLRSNGDSSWTESGVENGFQRAMIEAFGCDGVGLWTKGHRGH